MKRVTVHLLILTLMGCSSPQMRGVPEPLVARAGHFETYEECVSALAAIVKAEEQKAERGEETLVLSNPRCEKGKPSVRKGAAVIGLVAWFVLLGITIAAWIALESGA